VRLQSIILRGVKLREVKIGMGLGDSDFKINDCVQILSGKNTGIVAMVRSVRGTILDLKGLTKGHKCEFVDDFYVQNIQRLNNIRRFKRS